MKNKRNFIKFLLLLSSLFTAVGCSYGGNSTSEPRKISAITMNDSGEWIIAYNDGGSVNIGEVEVDENSPMFTIEDGYFVFDGVKTEVKLEEGQELKELTTESVENISPIESANAGRYEVSGSKVSFVENENYNCKKYAVSPGESYVTSFAIQADAVFGVLFLDATGNCISTMFHKKNKLTYFENVELTVPDGAMYMIINSRNDFVSEATKVVREKYYRLNSGTTELRVAAFNCGQFDYASEENPLSTEEYAANWKEMITTLDCDMFAFEDVINTNVDNGSITEKNGFGSGVTPNEVLNSNTGTSMITVNGVASCLRVSSKMYPKGINVIPCDYKITGSNAETARFYALRLTYNIEEQLVAFYTLHLVAEGHISGTPVDGGYSLSQRLRQTQFSQIIKDSQKFDKSIIVGDFNAQIGSEYDIFVQNNYSMVNDGSIGTLRETLCADNIIVSEGISINSYDVIDDYELNTDHLGLYANIII